MIHEVDGKKDKCNHKKQKTTPIAISDIKKSEGMLRKRSNYALHHLKERTLPFSWFITQQNYQNVLKFPQRLYDVLARINEERNSLHYFARPIDVFCGWHTDDYVFLKNVVQTKVTKRLQKLRTSISDKVAIIVQTQEKDGEFEEKARFWIT